MKFNKKVDSVRTELKAEIEVVNDNLGNLDSKIVSIDDNLGNLERTMELSAKAMKSGRTEIKTEIESVKEAFNVKLEHLDESIVTTTKALQNQAQNLGKK